MTQSDLRPSPLDALWQPTAILWTMIAGEALALILVLTPTEAPLRWRNFLLLSIGIQWMLLCTLASVYLLRRALRQRPALHIAYVVLALLLAWTWAISGMIGFFFRDVWQISDDQWRSTNWRLVAIVMTVGALGVAVFQTYWKAQQMTLRAKQSELEALQARIRPHFLFNTLNTGAALVHRRPEEVERLLLDLADLFRAALAGPRDITLEDELALARRYLEIESLRFGDRLRIEWKLPREIPRVMVPSLSIQPLVENAIRHGIERRPDGGEIEIAVSTMPETVVVRIINPIATGGENRPGHQVGLNASQVRIEALTGGRGSVLTQQEGRRFIATVRLPADGDATR
jgi:two-component system sensor histidine kinase AlgZ